MKATVIALVCACISMHAFAQPNPAPPSTAPSPAPDATKTVQLRISVLKDAAEALVTLGKALSSISDGVAHAVKTGAAGVSYVSAKREHEHLRGISLSLGKLRGDQSFMVATLEDYLRQARPSGSRPHRFTHGDHDSNWRAAQDSLVLTLGFVNETVERLRNEQSDLVTEDVYGELMGLLGARRSLLSRLRDMGGPRTPAELQELERVVARYRELVVQLNRATSQLNAYIKARGPR